MKIKFGMLKDNKIHLMEFCPDPDGTSSLWFKRTGKFATLAHRRELDQKKVKHTGKCYDTMEYFSKVGDVLKELVDSSPKGTKLVVFSYGTWSGTKTFLEEVNVTYYA